MNQNSNSPRSYMCPPRRSYGHSPRKPDFFSRPRMICSCNLEFLDAGAFQKHLKASHAEIFTPLPPTSHQMYQQAKK